MFKFGVIFSLFYFLVSYCFYKVFLSRFRKDLSRVVLRVVLVLFEMVFFFFGGVGLLGGGGGCRVRLMVLGVGSEYGGGVGGGDFMV